MEKENIKMIGSKLEDLLFKIEKNNIIYKFVNSNIRKFDNYPLVYVHTFILIMRKVIKKSVPEPKTLYGCIGKYCDMYNMEVSIILERNMK